MSRRATSAVPTARPRHRGAAPPGPRPSRDGPVGADVGVGLVNRDELLVLLDDAIAGAARGAPPGPLAAEGARGVPGQGPPRGRGHHRGRPGPGRADGRAHRGRARGRAGGRSRSSTTPRPRPAALKHEAEDYIDQKLARSRSCSSGRCRRSQKGRERLQVVVDLPEAEVVDGRRRAAASSTRT